MRLVAPELRAMMPDTLRLRRVLRHPDGTPQRGGDGELLHSAGVTTIKGRITSAKRTLTRNPEGSDVRSGTKIICDRSLGWLTVHDAITLEDGSTPEIQAVETVRDEFGPYYDAIWLP